MTNTEKAIATEKEILEVNNEIIKLERELKKLRERKQLLWNKLQD